MTGPNVPNALPISCGGNRSRISPKPCGIMIAAKRPCTTRATIRLSGDQATAHRSEAVMKPTIPMSRIRRRPNMSPSRPPVSSPTASASV